jgi:hypothetical protein
MFHSAVLSAFALLGRRQQGRRHAGPLELAPHGDEAHRRRERQHHGDGQQQVREAPVQRLRAQREVQAEAAVGPGREHHPELCGRARQVPQPPDHAHVGAVDAVGLVGAAYGRQVGGYQQRQRKAQQHAQALQRRHAQRAPLPQRDDGQRQVREGRAVQQHRARQAVPELLRAAQHGLGQRRRNRCPANGSAGAPSRSPSAPARSPSGDCAVSAVSAKKGRGECGGNVCP